MAKNFRIENLSQEDQHTLQQLTQYDPTALSEIEKTGKLPDRIAAKLDPSTISSLSGLLSKLPSANDAYQKVIGTGVDEANLSDQELQDRIAAYQGLNKEPDKVSNPGADTLSNEIVKLLKSGNTSIAYLSLSDPQIKSVADQAASDFLNNRFSQQRFEELVVNAKGGGIAPAEAEGLKVRAFDLAHNLNDRVGRGEFTRTDQVGGVDNSGDVKRIQAILADRANVAGASAKVDEFLKTAPGQLDQERTAFFNSQRTRAKDYITGEYAPQVAERLAARGLGDSGQVGASIQSKYSNLLEGIDASQIDQMNSDTQYFADQAYNKVFSDLIAARTDVSGTIANERQNLRTKSNTDFAKRQADIEGQFNLDLFKQQSKAAYDTYNAQVTRQKQQAVDAQNASTAQQVGQGVGTVAIAALL